MIVTTTTTSAAIFYQAKREFHSRRDPYDKPVALTLVLVHAYADRRRSDLHIKAG